MTLRHTLSREEARNYPSPEFLGRFPLGFVTIVASKPGTGKTWYMLYNLFEHSRDRRVGAVIGDCAPELVYDRVRRIVNENNTDNIYAYFLSDMQQQGFSMDLSSKEGMDNLENLIQKYNLDLLYLDTLISLITADESSQKEMTPIIVRLSQIASSHRCAIIINHHLRKNGNKNAEAPDIDEVIGSSILTRLSSTVLTIKKQGRFEMTINTVKNWFSDTGPLLFRIIDNEGAITLVESDSSQKTLQGARQESLSEYIEKLAKNTPITIEGVLKSFKNLSIPYMRDTFSKLQQIGSVQDTTPTDRFMDKVFLKL